MPEVMDKDDPSYDLPEPTEGGKAVWMMEALNRVLKQNPERLDWREVDAAAHAERRDRMIGLAARSARAPYPLADVHKELDRLMDEYLNPPTASALASTSPRSDVSIEMETD